jgi:proline iminopeptidase
MTSSIGERFVTTGAALLWSTANGQGMPIGFFNGGPGCDDYLEPVARLLPDSYQAIRWEGRGCGRSSWDGQYDLDTTIHDAEAVRQAYNCKRWVLLGHSHGPNLALAYALRYPQRTIGIVGIAGGNILNDRNWSETRVGAPIADDRPCSATWLTFLFRVYSSTPPTTFVPTGQHNNWPRLFPMHAMWR